jgi:hypothetical protein
MDSSFIISFLTKDRLFDVYALNIDVTISQLKDILPLLWNNIEKPKITKTNKYFSDEKLI